MFCGVIAVTDKTGSDMQTLTRGALAEATT